MKKRRHKELEETGEHQHVKEEKMDLVAEVQGKAEGRLEVHHQETKPQRGGAVLEVGENQAVQPVAAIPGTLEVQRVEVTCEVPCQRGQYPRCQFQED